MPELENPISKSDLYVILTECINNSKAHDIILSTLDNTYKAESIQIDTTISDLQNIQKFLKILKKKDIQIHKMLPNYLMNQDLDGLINGTLLADKAKLLAQKSTYADNPLECDPDAINRAIVGYSDELKKYDCNNDANKSKCVTYDNSIIQLKSKLVELKASTPSPGNTKCIPPLLKSEAEGIMDGAYANLLAKIVKSQDIAIDSIKADATNNIAQFYSKTVDVGKPPPSPLDQLM